MLTVEQAKNTLLKNVNTLKSVQIKTENALNFILSENIYSPLDLPPFNQSAMDGFAVAQTDEHCYKVIGEIKAGDKNNIEISTGEAVRIFTGAPVPESAYCVIMQEKVNVKKNEIYIEENHFNKNDNIRLKGSQIKKGELALSNGTLLNPAAIGFLSSLGIHKIDVYKKPVVSIIVTGNELQRAGKKLKYGQIYESNSQMLNAALQAINIFSNKIFRVKDEKKVLSEKIKNSISTSDIVIISGGISVGKYDLVKECLGENGVKEIFYKVAQKPGKPLFVGKKKDKIIFALPGNPAATLVCFYEYVYPAIRKMSGFSEYFLPMKKIKLLNEVNKKNDRAYFLKGKITNENVVSLDGQESYMLKSFAEANALIYLPMEKKNVKKNEYVEVHLL